MERLRQFGEYVISRLSPFGTVVIHPWGGSKMEFEDLGDDTDQAEVSLTSRGELIIPTGGSARVTIKSKGQVFSFTVDDYKERTGHTPGAKISGEYMDFSIDPENRELRISGIGTFDYIRE